MDETDELEKMDKDNIYQRWDSDQWGNVPPSKQKLCNPQRYDERAPTLSCGAHIPQMIFLGKASQCVRSGVALEKRKSRRHDRRTDDGQGTIRHAIVLGETPKYCQPLLISLGMSGVTQCIDESISDHEKLWRLLR